jgi:histidinol-phosphate aminotransferase
VPLADPKGAATHDVKAMMAASSAPGVIYICNPNNPTGTLTSRADINYAVDHLPKGSVLLIDEAYIHFSDASSALDLVKAGKDVIVLRTFSKLYGMAGLRMGFVVAKPELLAKLTALGGMSALPITAVAAASASLRDQTLVPTRKKIIGDTRTETIAWLTSNGYACTPSESNCFMVDVRRPGKEVMAAMAAKEIFIGRVWPAWPTHVRITVGTADEMLAFRKAFLEVMGSSTAGLLPPLLPRKLAAHPFTHLS